MIKVKNICKHFETTNGKELLFNNLSFEVPNGQFLSILGPNGCGKSTLFNLITGVDSNYAGKIIINSNSNPIHKSVSYMLQNDLLLPWLPVIDNIIIGGTIQGMSKAELIEKSNYYLNLLKIEHLKNKYPTNLSGGERQKVALIRTIILGTEILLLDEPFSAIDYNTRLELQATIYKYAEENNTTVILVSHDIDEAIAVSDRIIILGAKPNGIILDISIELEIKNRNPVTARQHSEFAKYFKTVWENYPR